MTASKRHGGRYRTAGYPAAVDRIPVVLCIDVEPDERNVDRDRRSPWAGFEALWLWFSGLRSRVSSMTGSAARFSWFLRMDPQVEEAYGSPTWAVTTYRRYLDELRARGDELGVHTHAYRWDGARGSWIIDHGSQSWLDHCVRVSMGAFHDALGSRCALFRFGDHWMSDATARLLAELGVRHDLTLEPGMETPTDSVSAEPRTGKLPDLTSVPRYPYRPSREDFRTPDPTRCGGLWMLPVTTGRLRPDLRQARRLYCRIRGRHLASDVVPLNLGLRPLLFRSLVRPALASPVRRHLVAVVRTDTGTSPREMARLRANMEYLLAHPLSGRFVFCPPAEAVRRLERS
jgi:hypothetical protein